MVGGRLAVAAGDFSLCLSECLLRDDSLVVILYVILRQLAGIFLGYACQYILDKCLSLLSAAGDRLTEWFALCPTARDVQLKGEAAQVVVFTCGSLVFAVAACLSWGSSVKTKGKRSLCPYDNHATSNL